MRRTREEALQTRETVLNAAAQVMARLGVTAFTIDAVAQEAGVTKGGVLHHFPSKDALIDGLIDQVIGMFNARLADALAAEAMDQQADPPGRWLRAYIRTIFSIHYGDINLLPTLAAAVAADPQRLDRIRRDLLESQRAVVQDGLDPIQATLIRLAVDGVVFARALNLDVLDPETSQQVHDALVRLTHSVPVQS